MIKIPPVCLFPTQVLVIDDSEPYLETLEGQLSYQNMTYKFMSSPQAALAYLNDEYKRDAFIDRMMKRVDETSYEKHIIEMNVSELYKELYNPKRFKQISCIVVDYDMPGMTGVELCRQLKDPYIQKILLTGAADQEIAVKAFNEGSIDHFVTKTKTDNTRLQQILHNAQYDYFRQLSAPAHHCILGEPDLSTALREPMYKELLQQLTTKHHIVEYYLFEQCGSLIMADKKGKLYGLFVTTQQDIEAMANTAAEQLGSKSKLTKALMQKEKIVCYHKGLGKQGGPAHFPPLSEIENYLRSARPLQGYFDTFSYAFSDDSISLTQGAILSFDQYQNML